MSEPLERLLEQLSALPKAQRRAAALLANPVFEQAVGEAADLDDAALLALAGGETTAACVALETLAQRPRDAQLADALAALAAHRPVVTKIRVDRGSALPGWRSLVVAAG